MPTYEFRCPKGHEFEKFYRSMSGAPLEVACPTCAKPAERQFSAGAGLVFKGSGFYITDYGKDGKKTATPSATSGEGGSAKSPAESGSGKTEPAGKSEAKPATESKSSTEAKPSADSSPATASKSAAKKSSGRAKTSE
ncbi:MAG TPA: zinc ribbon domain-containing protein [Gemmatimonadaceae bacterium]|nr:zinc ribbon domain-containing protein [Gemmatimonadaceae bacterium]